MTWRTMEVKRALGLKEPSQLYWLLFRWLLLGWALGLFLIAGTLCSETQAFPIGWTYWNNGLMVFRPTWLRMAAPTPLRTELPISGADAYLRMNVSFALSPKLSLITQIPASDARKSPDASTNWSIAWNR